MWKYLIVIVAIGLIVAFSPRQSQADISKDDKVLSVLADLGYDVSDKQVKSVDGASAAVGKDLVNQGFSKLKDEKKARRQSRHFVCTSCHNVEREDPDLTSFDPQARLEFTLEKGLPFLQATTLYGAINRTSFYNGDYEKKYGELVEPARNDLREAIQLCAIECAQGRKLKPWEMESIVAYLHDIGLTIGDLQLSKEEILQVSSALEGNGDKNSAIELINSKYAAASPATFLYPPEDRKVGSGLVGDAANGKLIYNNSCLHCHYQKRYSFLHLDNNPMALNHLKKNIATYSKHSIYQVTRWGTFSKFGKGSYMPRYTEEKMSKQQLADLRAYIENPESVN